jgi:ring-1,2-phenylacetyl-CoA epoxidase subunit PaaD
VTRTNDLSAAGRPIGRPAADTLQEVARAAAAGVLDPEVPVLTIEALGVLRDVTVDEAGGVVVTITPTYSGCPAMDAIRHDVEGAVRHAGFEHVEVRTVLSPAWSTDWMTESGRQALADFGIAPPPVARPAGGPVLVQLSVRCPQCGSARTREASRFGSTACKSMWVCEDCREPFDHFKAHR